MEEVWKDIKGYEGLYQVSNLGRIKGLKRKVKSPQGSSGFRTIKEKILIPHISNRGYAVVNLSKDNIKVLRSIHGLVCDAFLENPNNYHCINHKDENKLNNCVNNLEWCTTRYNNLYNNKIDRLTKARMKKIVQIDNDNKAIKIWESSKTVGDALGISNTLITRCCRERGKTAGGYKWKYADD